MNITRKLKLIPLALTMFMLSGCNQIIESQDLAYAYDEGHDFTIAIATDIHYLSDDINDHGRAFDEFVASGDGKQLGYIVPIVDAFVDDMKKLSPDMLIISGDLTTNGGKASHLSLISELERIEAQGTRVYVIPGNHDINNPWARGFSKEEQVATETISSKEFSQLYASFGYDEAESKDEHSLSYLVTPSKSLWLLMIDSNIYDKNMQYGYPRGDGELSLETLEWIKTCMNLAKEEGATVIPVMHHNLLDHSKVIKDGYTLNNSDMLIDMLMPEINNLVLSGHIHIQDIIAEKKNDKAIYDIVTNGMSVYPHHYGILDYSTSNENFTYSTSIVDVQSWVTKQGLNDESLLEFEDYSERFFGQFAYDLLKKLQSKEMPYSDEELEAMADVMRTLNLNYFSGNENEHSQAILESEGYKLLTEMEGSFLKMYAMSIVADQDIDDNYLQFNVNGE